MVFLYRVKHGTFAYARLGGVRIRVPRPASRVPCLRAVKADPPMATSRSTDVSPRTLPSLRFVSRVSRHLQSR